MSFVLREASAWSFFGGKARDEVKGGDIPRTVGESSDRIETQFDRFPDDDEKTTTSER